MVGRPTVWNELGDAIAEAISPSRLRNLLSDRSLLQVAGVGQAEQVELLSINTMHLLRITISSCITRKTTKFQQGIQQDIHLMTTA